MGQSPTWTHIPHMGYCIYWLICMPADPYMGLLQILGANTHGFHMSIDGPIGPCWPEYVAAGTRKDPYCLWQRSNRSYLASSSIYENIMHTISEGMDPLYYLI